MQRKCRICYQQIEYGFTWGTKLFLQQKSLLCSSCREEFKRMEMSMKNKMVIFRKSIFIEELLERFLKLGDYALAEVFGELLIETYHSSEALYVGKEKINDRLGYNPELEVLMHAGIAAIHINEVAEGAALNIFTIIEGDRDCEQEFIVNYCAKNIREIYFTALFEK